MTPIEVEPEFAEFLKDRLGVDACSIRGFQGGCIARIYRVEIPGRPPVFVKRRKSDSGKSLAFLRAVSPHPLLARPVLDGVLRFGDETVVCLEWQQTRGVALEDMNEAQFRSFVSGYRELSAVLRRAPSVGAPRDFPAMHERIADNLSGRPFVRRLLASIAGLGLADFAYGEGLSVIHGDFHDCNYGFAGDALAAFFDFDAIRYGGAVDDLAYAFADRYKNGSLRGWRRRRLEDRMRMLRTEMGADAAEWRRAINRYRIQMVYRRIKDGKAGLTTMIKIASRDHRLKRLLDLVAAS